MLESENNKDNRDVNHLSEIRNIGIAAHIDAGKTTTTESILYLAGKIHKVGKVHDGNTVTDFDPQERERGITIFSAATTVFWKDSSINLVDTPGHIDFTMEVERCLRVLDGAIVVIDGKEGVEAQTETVWNQADKYEIPRIIFINKMDGVDNVENRFIACYKSLEEKLHAKILIVQFPIGEYQGIEGIIDLIEKKAHYFQGDREENYQTKEIPANLQEKVQTYRQELLEKVIAYDEKLGLKYLEGKHLSSQEIKSLIRKAVLSREYFAVFCGSAYKHVGVKLLLDGVVDYLPSPLDRSKITIFSDQQEKEISLSDYPVTLGLAFKIVALPFGKLTYVRVYCGKIPANSYIYNVNRNKKERVSRLVQMHANKQEKVSEAKMGDIVALIGLEYTKTGDTLCSEKKDILLESISFAEPVISLAIEPKTKQDEDKLNKSLESLAQEDPTFHYVYNKDTRQRIISGMGELHLEVLVERLKREFGVEVNTGKPQVAYRETIKSTAKLVEIEYFHKKQTGGAGQHAKVKLEFEPDEIGKDFKLETRLRGEAVGKGNCYVPAVEEGLLRAFSAGPLLNCPVVGVKVTLTGGDYHEVDSSDLAFKLAGYYAFKENTEKFNLTLLEPIMKLEVSNIHENYYGTVLASITSKRGIVEGIEKKKETYLLKAKIPLSETFGYSTTLRSLTEGRGTHSLQFSHYQEVPSHIIEELVGKK